MPKVIILSGHIGFEVSASFIRGELAAAKGQPVRIDLSSPGGFVFEGIEIFNLIREYKGETEIRLMSLAASMGSYIALAGDKVTAFDNATFMIHNALTIAIGNHNDFRKTANRLEGISNIIAKTYSEKSGKSLEEIKQMMDDNTYLFGNEMLDAGFVDEIIESDPKDKKDKDSAVVEARLMVEGCFNRMRESEAAKADLEKAAAYINHGISDDINIDINGIMFDPEAPFPNEHACRIRNPGDFQKGSFRRIKSSGTDKKFDIIIGRLKGKTTTTTQAFRYPKSTWTTSEARKHCTDHNGILFEPASGYSGCDNCDKDKNKKKEVKNMTLQEFLADNPSARIEFDKAISDAQVEGAKKKKEEMQVHLDKVSVFVAMDKYPSQIKNLIAEVLQGKEDFAALKGAVTMFDASEEKRKSDLAIVEAAKLNDTKPGAGGSGNVSEDGTISNEDEYQAGIKRMKEGI